MTTPPPPQTPPQQLPPNSYEECIKLKNSIIQKSFPETCVTPDGQRFIRQLSHEEQNRLKPSATPNTQLGEAPNKQTCDQLGGVWRSWGLIGQEYCQITAQDGDKTCTNGSQCNLGKCLSETGSSPGKCQTYKNTFGCFSFIEASQASETLCID